MEFNKFPSLEFENREERDTLTELHAANGDKPIVQRAGYDWMRNVVTREDHS